ncbi:MAG: hypothetical protein AMJ53_01550 [Gammaproteobacteria bacterium SG8_11]|nr:MAG: hypothetical protein AMJ53_01550 [Gammaproteobacteria bacterium SG8_11]
MPKKFIKRFIPHHDTIHSHKALRFLGPLIQDPFLLHLNRRSVSGAVGVGLFLAFVPVPFQMILAAISAVIIRINLPITMAMVWITNPITIPPMFYFAYKVGVWLLGTPKQEFDFELSWEWLTDSLGTIWEPFLLGCFFVGSAAGLLGSITIRYLWRLKVQQSWNERKQKRSDKKSSKDPLEGK